ncbi:hypothetical protein OVS_03955 [Mycoplasma ovis str. Michigan]|uniref:Chromosome partition protein Smc n=1 Tax=Mycoplasma ovis str. Michigan TaxID=1415773 RepID=A0ABM5P218_9MOLU|nr:hypothetical protein [Mycoplasma ovis]AHC40522.1 hypothetical protein OVS_03955 [Mycoplasma ovis str. Michigan]
MPSLRFLITGLSGILTGGTAVGLGAGDWLFGGQSSSSSHLMEEKNKAISELKEELSKQDKDLLAEQAIYEETLKELEQQLQELQDKTGQFESRKNSLADHLKKEDDALTKAKNALERSQKGAIKAEEASAHIEKLQTQLQEKATKLESTKTERDLLKKANLDAREENSKVQRERDSLNKKLERLNQLQRIFEELRKAGYGKEQIVNVDKYRAFLWNAITHKTSVLWKEKGAVLSNLHALTKQIRNGSQSTRQAGDVAPMDTQTVIGNPEKEKELLEKIKAILDKVS